MSQYRYYGHGSQMSADLKRVIHRVRTSRPDLFAPVTIAETSMDGDGKVTTTERSVVKAHPLEGARRHALSVQRGRF